MTNILFIGAGASYGARIDHQKRPPRGPELLGFLQNNLEGLANQCSMSELISCVWYLTEAKRIIDKHGSGENNFELFLQRLNADDREVVHRALMVAFSDLTSSKINFDLGFTTRPDEYDRLIVKLGIAEGNWELISLNYEILAEESLQRNGITYQYPFVPFRLGQNPSSDSVNVHKPHGSINFFGQYDHQFAFGGKLPETPLATEFYGNLSGDLRPHLPLVYAGMNGSQNVTMRASNKLIFPIIANYTHGKESDYNEPTLKSIREQALKVASKANRIVIVGVNPKVVEEDDSFVYRLLRLPFNDIDYIGVPGEDAEFMKKLQSKTRLHLEGLKGFTNNTL